MNSQGLTMKRHLLIFAAFFLMLFGQAQQSIGLVAGNYAGTLGNAINPGLMANSWLKSDINIVAASVFAEVNH